MSIKCSEVVNYNICQGYYKMISLVFDDELKYIRSYKSLLSDYFKKVLSLQVNLGLKLGQPPEEFANASWLNCTPILKLTQYIPKMIQKQLESIKNFLDEFEKSIEKIDDFLKEKSNSIKNYQEKYENSNEELLKKYLDVEKIKATFLESIEKTEDTILKYYNNKKKLDNAKINKLNDNDFKIIYDKNKEYEAQKKILISGTKKYEKEYINIIEKTRNTEKKFINTINDSINGIKDISSDISSKVKDILVSFFTSIRDSYKIPLDLIDSSLLNLKDLNQKEITNNSMIATFNKEKNLEPVEPQKYNLKSIELNNENEKKNKSFWSKLIKGKNSDKNKNKFIQFEDGFEEMTYFEDEANVYTIKEIFKNFVLINTNELNIEVEEEKNITKNYTCKIISNMSVKSNNENNIEEEEKNNLINLLSKHHNRIIFLHKLNDYRAMCQFELNERSYKLLGELFFYIINISKTEKDYHCVEMVIILSKTYYILKDKKTKVYLQNLIIDNKYFKLKDFWEELLIYSISKEVARSNKREKIGRENENKLKVKNDNIIFSQLLTLIDNMFDFGADENLVKNIIEPKLIFYKIGDNLKDTINDVIGSKIKEKANNSKEEGKNRER